MSKSHRRREQAPKSTRRLDYRTQAMIELRQGSRTSPVPSGKVNQRRPKHVKRGWSED